MRGIELPAALREDPEPANIELSNGYLTQNFWVATEEELGIAYPARGAQPWYQPESIFTPQEWREVSAGYNRPG
jgi:hypothetical protein